MIDVAQEAKEQIVELLEKALEDVQSFFKKEGKSIKELLSDWKIEEKSLSDQDRALIAALNDWEFEGRNFQSIDLFSNRLNIISAFFQSID